MDTISVQKTRRRKFIKIHAGINIKTRHILFNKSTTSKVSDISELPEAIGAVSGKIDAIFADGGYDSKGSYQQTELDTKIVIPPRINTVKDKHTHQRNEAIRYIVECRKSR
jgi:hypothetical protein